MIKFPKNFAWGAATSGPQSEGCFKKKYQNVFDYWYSIDPKAFYDGVGPDTGSIEGKGGAGRNRKYGSSVSSAL